ncbi:serine/threonine-protein kinase bri1, putative [Ricinus communis]|uniref:Serine/threonine-protein kinase bri1, putative n=1 Tax=Ricinus communis TaxID=3988 RepID=B9RMG8_RICCO|nr:serine/threonine-protein kinase bri1, putative [Ricinus communis]|eukprot:XP_025012396.1 receptor-like protein EIX1 [Ricinus communis]
MACSITPLKLLFLLLILLADSIFLGSKQSNSNAAKCIDAEREALLKFKGSLKDPSGWLSSWVGEDCCNWMGVSCNNLTDNVVMLDLKSPDVCDLVNVSDAATSYNRSCLGGTLNPSLLDLTYLNYLDVSDNNFQGAAIPEFIGSLKNLRYLDLSQASFSGLVPPHLGNLSNLIHLDLTTYWNPTPLWVSDINWLSGLPFLQYLGLGRVDLSKASTKWLQAINMLPALLELHLYSNKLQGFSQSLPLVNFTSLLVFDVTYNNFSSPIPQWVFNISTVVTVQLYDCQFSGHIPEISWGSLCNLKRLDLSSNSLTGQIKEFIDALTGCNNNSLESLDLSSNNLMGNLPDSLGSLSNLETLGLYQNSFSGLLPESIGNLSSLSALDMSFNKMTGNVPETIGQLSRLYKLGLYGNSWEGIMTEIHLHNLTRLDDFSLSSTTYYLIFNVRPDWTPLFNLTYLTIDDCQVGPTFPPWLKTQNQISQITLSNAAISDTIPAWFWTLSPNIWWLDLSVNQLRGTLPVLTSIGNNLGAWVDLGFNRLDGSVPLWSNVTNLSLRYNLLSGSIPSKIGQVMSRLENLDLSNNLLNGSIPQSISRLERLYFLDLSSNYLSGNIPSNWQGLKMLMVLDLSNNSLSGEVPNSICLLPSLIFLKLSSNNLSGELSSTVQNCTGLYSLDLGYNRFTGTISAWIADNLLALSYIGLRANLLTGIIPEQLCSFLNLHILDLAHNNFSGYIPKCLGDLPAWKTLPILYHVTFPSSQHIEFSTHLELVVKGNKNTYTKIISLVNILDLSHNNLTREIPEELTNLSALGTLNLSWNKFSGQIPESIGNMRWLESLDLSCNHLVGSIPPSMSSLTSLSYLNLSYNNLSGRIPSTNQFLTFNDPSIYEGNPLLCGPPLLTNCSTLNDKGANGDNKDQSEDQSEDEHEHDTFWFYVSMGVGFIVGFWVVCGTLVIKKTWRHAYFKFIDEMKDRLFLVIFLNMARLRTKLESN